MASIIGGAILAVGGFAVTPASADHVDPVDVVGNDNPTCADIDATYVNEFKIDGAPANQVYNVSAEDSGVMGGATITVSNAGPNAGVFEFDWASSIAWDAVIVKQGDGAAVYLYNPEVAADTDLHPSLTNGQPTGGISHVTFCRDNVTPTTTEEETTTTTEGTTTSETVLNTTLTQEPTTEATVAGVQVTKTLPRTGTSSNLMLTMAGAALIGTGLGLLGTARLRSAKS